MRRALVLLAGVVVSLLLASFLSGGMQLGTRTVNGQSYGSFNAHLNVLGLALFAFLFAIFFLVTKPEPRTCPRCGHAVRRDQAQCPASNVVFLYRR